jgi:hypothetical protein
LRRIPALLGALAAVLCIPAAAGAAATPRVTAHDFQVRHLSADLGPSLVLHARGVVAPKVLTHRLSDLYAQAVVRVAQRCAADGDPAVVTTASAQSSPLFTRWSGVVAGAGEARRLAWTLDVAYDPNADEQDFFNGSRGDVSLCAAGTHPLAPITVTGADVAIWPNGPGSPVAVTHGPGAALVWRASLSAGHSGF